MKIYTDRLKEAMNTVPNLDEFQINGCTYVAFTNIWKIIKLVHTHAIENATLFLFLQRIN